MTNTELKIQQVTGLIRKSPVSTKSQKWKTKTNKAGRSDRSTGLYAEKNWDGSIKVAFNLNNYAEHNMAVADAELAQFADFAKTKGYTMIQQARWTYKIEAN
jgi:hypothetical protein